MSVFFTLSNIGSFLGILGAAHCGYEKAYAANCIWSIGNLILIIYALQTVQTNLAVMYVAFEICALMGIIKHHTAKPQGVTA